MHACLRVHQSGLGIAHAGLCGIVAALCDKVGCVGVVVLLTRNLLLCQQVGIATIVVGRLCQVRIGLIQHGFRTHNARLRLHHAGLRRGDAGIRLRNGGPGFGRTRVRILCCQRNGCACCDCLLLGYLECRLCLLHLYLEIVRIEMNQHLPRTHGLVIVHPNSFNRARHAAAYGVNVPGHVGIARLLTTARGNPIDQSYHHKQRKHCAADQENARSFGRGLRSAHMLPVGGFVCTHHIVFRRCIHLPAPV